MATTDQELGAGLVETLLMRTGGGMSGQPGLASSRHPVKVAMWSWGLRAETRGDQCAPKTLVTNTVPVSSGPQHSIRDAAGDWPGSPPGGGSDNLTG